MGIRSWLRKRRLDEDDFQEEIRAHLRIAAEERLADGSDPEEARYGALRELGNVTRVTEATRRVWTPAWIWALHDQASDVRFAFRSLSRNPGFALTVIAVLTLGIGLNATVFTMLKSIVLTPIAGVHGGARLTIMLAETSAGRQVRVSYPDYQYLRDHDQAFTGLFGSAIGTANVGRGRSARQIWVEVVTGNYFDILGVRAELGRTLQASDESAPGRQPVVVLAEGLWRREFAGDPQIVGKTVEFNGTPLTVVGVAAASFHGTSVVYDIEAFIPVAIAPELGFTFSSQERTPAAILSDRRAAFFFPQGYLRAGVSRAAAAAQADVLWTDLLRDRPLSATPERLRVVPFWQTPNGAPSFVLPTLGVLTAMALLVLMIACANVAGLVLVRGLSRRGEIAVRTALGASRARIVRLLVIENLVLAVPGAVLGMLLARSAVPSLVGYAQRLASPQRIFFNVEVDGLVIGFAALVACACSLLSGFIPALEGSRVNLVSTINADASPRGAGRGRFRPALVVAQVAVSVLLLVGAGLATRSVQAARAADPGFDPTHVTAVAMDVTQNRYDESRGRVFYRKLLDSVRAVGGVEAAALAMYVPMSMTDTRAVPVTVDGYAARREDDMTLMSNTVTSGYFRTLRIPVLAGREFEDRDEPDAAPVIIVNRTFAERFWGGAEQALGKRVRVARDGWRTVIGVAADVKYARIDEAPRAYFYLPFEQAYRPRMILHTRGAGPVDLLVQQTRAQVTALDPDLPILSARTLAEQMRGAFIFLDLMATMLFVFGAAGMALAAMGTYGLVSYTVKQSTHEIGIRMALGASGRSVVLGFVTRGVRLGAIGATLGIATALAASGLLDRVLFGVSPTDGASFIRALAIVLAGVILATLVPAWRASRTNPLSALRHH